ncbi:hypothetical protein FACS1894109_15600 [Spirochaetia bacterium]|nr:hypothetical protein FACS1894109_15600 [Spirochaetia bacterium]
MTGRELCKKHGIKVEKIAELAVRLGISMLTKRSAYIYEFTDDEAKRIVDAERRKHDTHE